MGELDALRLARVQLLARFAQLNSCRVCGEDKKRYQQALDTINRMIKERENAVRTRTEEPC